MFFSEHAKENILHLITDQKQGSIDFLVWEGVQGTELVRRRIGTLVQTEFVTSVWVHEVKRGKLFETSQTFRGSEISRPLEGRVH